MADGRRHHPALVPDPAGHPFHVASRLKGFTSRSAAVVVGVRLEGAGPTNVTTTLPTAASGAGVAKNPCPEEPSQWGRIVGRGMEGEAVSLPRRKIEVQASARLSVFFAKVLLTVPRVLQAMPHLYAASIHSGPDSPNQVRIRWAHHPCGRIVENGSSIFIPREAMIMVGSGVRRVLVATDFTETSPALLAVGVETARKFGAELIALYVFDPAAYEEILGESLMPLDAYTSRLRMELLNQVVAAGAEMRARVEVVDGRNVALEILSAAARLDADLIVIGTHGRTGLRRTVHGSVAEEVLRHARTMVLVTPLSVLAATQQSALAAS